MASIKSRAKSAVENAAEDADIESRFEQAKNEFHKIAASLSEMGSAKAREYSQMATNAASDLKGEVNAASGDAIDTFLEQLSQLESDIAKKIRSKPLQALAIAGGVGFLLALLSRR